MAKFTVVNCSDHNIELIIPAPPDSRRNGACFVLESSRSLDILPWAGTLEACRRIAHLQDLKHRNLIKIVEEP